MNQYPSSRNAGKNIRAALVIAGMQVGGALLLTLARTLGIIDGDTATRGTMVLLGLAIAAYGNRMPKMLEGPAPESLGVAATKQAVLRVGGWAMLLGGLAYAGAWAFAPRDAAVIACIVAVAAAMAVLLGYWGWRVFAAQRSTV